MTPHRVREIRHASHLPSSVDQPLGDSDSLTLSDLVAAEPQYGPEASLDDALLAQATQAVLSDVLTPRERIVIEMRFGIGGRHIYPPADVAAKLGITRDRVSHIEHTALAKLRASAQSTSLLHYLAA